MRRRRGRICPIRKAGNSLWRLRARPPVPAAQVCGLKWSPDDRELASGGNDNQLLVWNAHSPNPLVRFTAHTVSPEPCALPVDLGRMAWFGPACEPGTAAPLPPGLETRDKRLPLARAAWEVGLIKGLWIC